MIHRHHLLFFLLAFFLDANLVRKKEEGEKKSPSEFKERDETSKRATAARPSGIFLKAQQAEDEEINKRRSKANAARRRFNVWCSARSRPEWRPPENASLKCVIPEQPGELRVCVCV